MAIMNRDQCDEPIGSAHLPSSSGGIFVTVCCTKDRGHRGEHACIEGDLWIAKRQP